MFIFPVIVCPEVMAAPVNGTLVISMPSSAQPLGVGTTATYSCDPGYVLVGDLTRTCEDPGTGTVVGTWSGSEVDPTCEYFVYILSLGCTVNHWNIFGSLATYVHSFY